MNKTERKMVDLLRRGRDEFGYVGVKAEFEAEGTRMDELLRLVEIAHRADLKLAVKIGGCEAVRDLLESKQVGVQYIIAPMVESEYSLSKYVLAKDKAYTADEAEDTEFLFNMETITGFNNGESITAVAASGGIAGLVFGRSDFVGSLGKPGDYINEPEVTDYICQAAEMCHAKGLDVVVGGGVSVDSLDALRIIREVHLSRFETRKVLFAAAALDVPNIGEGMLGAVHFELMWLQNKRDYYGAIHREDEKRVNTLTTRWGLPDEAGQ